MNTNALFDQILQITGANILQVALGITSKISADNFPVILAVLFTYYFESY